MIRIDVVGDLCPIGRVEKEILIGSGNPANLIASTKDAVRGSDLFIVNLECPITNANNAIEKNGPQIKSKPEAFRLIGDLGIGLITLANNHILDFGQQGLADTLKLCSENKVDIVGAGLSLEEARKIYYKQIKGRTLAVINMAEREFSFANDSGGGANSLDLISVIRDINMAKKNADHVLFILHGGLESVYYPSPKSVRLLRFLAEQGLTAIIRHHPHCVQGYEVWKGVPIFYSLGNFLFDWYNCNKEDGWYEGILLELYIDENDHCTFEINPFEQCKHQPGVKMLEGRTKAKFMARFNERSDFIKDQRALKSEWYKELEIRKNGYFALLSIHSYLALRVIRRLGLLKYFRPNNRIRLLLENYLRCDAHREMLLDILERERLS